MSSYINLNELSITTQALLKKINEQAELKVDKDEVIAVSQLGDQIAVIGDVDIYNGIDIQHLSDQIYNNLPVSDVTNSQGLSFVENGTAKLPFEYVNIVSTQTTGKLTLYTACANSAWGIIFAVGDSGTRTNNYENRVYKPDGTLVTVSTQSGSRKWYDRFGTEYANQNITFYTNRFYFFKVYNDTLIFYEPRYSLTSDIPTKTSDLTNDSGYQTASQVNTLIGTAIGNINQFNVAIVQTLPTTNIDAHTIYFVPQQNAQTANSYEEWMYINSQWEMIGTTSIDLSGYAKEFVVTAEMTSVDGQNVWQGDKTWAQSLAAFGEHQVLVLVADGSPHYFLGFGEEGGYFGSVSFEQGGTIRFSGFIAAIDSGSVVPSELVTFVPATREYTIPDSTSDLTNDSGFITNADIPVTDVQDENGNSLVSNKIATIPNEVFWVTFTQENGTYTANKTFDETYQAHLDGKVVCAIDNSLISYLVAFGSTLLTFARGTSSTIIQYAWLKATGAITKTTKTYLTSANAVTSFNGSVGAVTFDVQDSSGSSLVSNGVATIPAIPTVPTNVSSFTNDAGYLTLATLPVYDGTVI